MLSIAIKKCQPVSVNPSQIKDDSCKPHSDKTSLKLRTDSMQKKSSLARDIYCTLKGGPFPRSQPLCVQTRIYGLATEVWLAAYANYSLNLSYQNIKSSLIKSPNHS